MPGETIALLRGVNVGGKRRLPMAELVAHLEAAGLDDVRTYLQSGNVMFTAPDGFEARTQLEALIAEQLGVEVSVIIRSATEMAEVLSSNPFIGVEPTKLHVAFLDVKPDPAAIAEVDPESWAPESFRVIGREVYLHLPGGMGRAKMPARLPFLADATIRNWNTVTALVALTSQ